MNKIYLIGNLTSDPVKTMAGDTDVCHFSIAVNRRFAGNEAEKNVDFFRITVFRKNAENCSKFLSKGRKVAVCGSIQLSEYTDKEGNRRQGVDVIADEVEFLSPKGEGDAPSYQGAAKAPVDKLEAVADDSLPF